MYIVMGSYDFETFIIGKTESLEVAKKALLKDFCDVMGIKVPDMTNKAEMDKFFKEYYDEDNGEYGCDTSLTTAYANVHHANYLIEIHNINEIKTLG